MVCIYIMFVSIYYVLNCTAKKPRAPKGGHVLAAPLPDGELLTDNHKKQWRIGKPAGSGGFGLLYLGKILTFFVQERLEQPILKLAKILSTK